MGDTMNIRKATSKDKSLFCTMAEEFYHLPAVLHAIDSKNFATTFQAFLEKSPFIDIYFAEENSVPVGYLLLSVTWSNEAGGICVWLEEIYIKEAFQGRGFGSQMIQFVKDSYPNAARFRLEISPDNLQAKKLYQRHGFEVLNYQQMICEETT